METTKTRATFSAKHHTNNAATQYTIRASRKITGTIWSPCEVWNNSHSDEYQITVNVAPGYTLKSYAPTLDEAIAEFDRLTDGKYNIDTKGIAATPTETPQISTETAETVNVSVEGGNAEKTPVFSSREEVITYLDSTHGVEYDAGEVVYLKDGCCAEYHEDAGEWCIYRNEDADECIEAVRIAPQSPETP